MAAQRDLCVSIHDVAPATWADCLRLHEAVRAVAPDLPLTWLLVPRFHGDAAASLAMDRALSQLLTEGHELALHGYTHLDTAAPRPGWRDHVLRRIYTQGEGEFAALGEGEALHRIDLGLAWFARRGWPVDGFVPPAWLASAGTRRALRQRPFIYTTSISRFYFLPDERSVWSPSLMYTARNRAGRCLSPPLTQAAALALALVGAPLVRLALHPADARHPALLRHAQHLIAHLLQQRRGITKRAFALRYLKGGAVGAETSGTGRATNGSAAALPGWDSCVRTNGDGHRVDSPPAVGAGNIRDWHSLPVPEWDRVACKFLNLQILETAAAAKTGTVTE
jgi:predicted deacetylase